MSDPKAVVHRYLQSSREALLWKLDGLGERDLRLPRTSTGTNLLGIVKHMANVEIGYFGDTFARVWTSPAERVAEEEFDTDPQADWYATDDESAAGILDLYRRVAVFADETIGSLPLDAPGRVPWWPEESATVSLGQVIVHVLTDLARHCGHADILREQLDGAVGMRMDATNIPDTDWPAYVAKLEAIADRS
jgi:uncharacterized damage-inducible protein DinB